MGNTNSTKLEDADQGADDEGETSSQISTPQKEQKKDVGVAKLYEHLGGMQATAKWVLRDSGVTPRFLGEGEEDDEDEEDEPNNSQKLWTLAVHSSTTQKLHLAATVASDLIMRFNPQERRADFKSNSVWALQFKSEEKYSEFVNEFQACLWENIHGVGFSDQGVQEVAGKDFKDWIQGKDDNVEMWDAEEEPRTPPPTKVRESVNTPTPSKCFALTLGALDRSYVIHSGGMDVFKNQNQGIFSEGKTIAVKGAQGFLTPKKGMLMRGESQMMLLSPQPNNKAESVNQMDIETGKVVTEWKFEKDSSSITIADITNDTKSAQLDASGSSFLGLDDNRLCRWDMRDRRGIVQTLDWSEGHNFSRGTNFQCMATTGSGSIVVGSKDGKVRLYGTTSMRQAKTSFPGLGAPITHVDVTYDGKWILATTDSYLMLISTVFRDKNNIEKTGFEGRAGSKFAPPRLLKLTPEHAAEAGQSFKFHGGQFSWVTEGDRQERNIVATVANFSVVWNFRRVKQSNHPCYIDQIGLKTCYCYKVLPKTDSIVSSRFMHDNYHGPSSVDAPLVVATPSELTSFNV